MDLLQLLASTPGSGGRLRDAILNGLMTSSPGLVAHAEMTRRLPQVASQGPEPQPVQSMANWALNGYPRQRPDSAPPDLPDPIAMALHLMSNPDTPPNASTPQTYDPNTTPAYNYAALVNPAMNQPPLKTGEIPDYFGNRYNSADKKGWGLMGPIPIPGSENDSGDAATEYSEDDQSGQYPSMVPTLTPDELDEEMAAVSKNKDVPATVKQKAAIWNAMRKQQGLTSFALPGEMYPVPTKK